MTTADRSTDPSTRSTDPVRAASPFTLVVGNDFSEASGHAFDEAVRVARRVPGSDIHVVHVIDHDATGAEARETADSLLVYLEDKVKALGGLERQAVGLHVRCGKPAREIAQLAKDVGADLIVLGAHKGAHVKEIFVGSVTQRLLAAAPCPVFVAGPAPEARDDAHEPAIEPPCPDCLATRRKSGGDTWWCDHHAKHHALAHSYSYKREWPLRQHDSAVIPTGVPMS
jgi:nucleotide-binding universal stress UspA family protein